MNKDKRNLLKSILSRIMALQDELKMLRTQEIKYRDKIPEHLVNSKRYNKSDEAIDLIDCAVEELEPVIDYIMNAIKLFNSNRTM